VNGAPGVNEGEAVALQALHDEALAAEQADADLLGAFPISGSLRDGFQSDCHSL